MMSCVCVSRSIKKQTSAIQEVGQTAVEGRRFLHFGVFIQLTCCSVCDAGYHLEQTCN